jgi:predicted DNA-binding protein
MAAARPRMHVTPSEKGYLLLQELSKLTGKAPATIVRELLDEAAPALEMTLEAVRQIKARPAEAQAAVNRMAAQAHQAIAQATLDLDTDKKPGRKPGRGAAKAR